MVEVGVILEMLYNVVEKVDCLFFFFFGVQGLCQIGGNIFINVGGIVVLVYGNICDFVFGLEVVLLMGEIWNGLCIFCKDNIGYDLK